MYQWALQLEGLWLKLSNGYDSKHLYEPLMPVFHEKDDSKLNSWPFEALAWADSFKIPYYCYESTQE